MSRGRTWFRASHLILAVLVIATVASAGTNSSSRDDLWPALFPTCPRIEAFSEDKPKKFIRLWGRYGLLNNRVRARVGVVWVSQMEIVAMSGEDGGRGDRLIFPPCPYNHSFAATTGPMSRQCVDIRTGV